MNNLDSIETYLKTLKISNHNFDLEACRTACLTLLEFCRKKDEHIRELSFLMLKSTKEAFEHVQEETFKAMSMRTNQIMQFAVEREYPSLIVKLARLLPNPIDYHNEKRCVLICVVGDEKTDEDEQRWLSVKINVNEDFTEKSYILGTSNFTAFDHKELKLPMNFKTIVELALKITILSCKKPKFLLQLK